MDRQSGQESQAASFPRRVRGPNIDLGSFGEAKVGKRRVSSGGILASPAIRISWRDANSTRERFVVGFDRVACSRPTRMNVAFSRVRIIDIVIPRSKNHSACATCEDKRCGPHKSEQKQQ